MIQFFSRKKPKFLLISAVLFALSMNVGHSASSRKNTPPQKPVTADTLDEGTLLRKSQISYRAEGGFSKVQSYSVIISCVDGKISTLATIHDPHLGADKGTLHQTGTLDKDQYLRLWKSAAQMGVQSKKDAPPLKQDILDEFTVTFDVQAGNWNHRFSAAGISRREASSYFAIRSLLDQYAQTAWLWDQYQELTKN